MISCHVRYEIDPTKIQQFDHYARLWMPLVEKFGGIHHGYFLPAEGKNYEAFAIFSFPSLAAYEDYRQQSLNDQDCMAAFAYAEQHNIVQKVERQFMRPVLASD